MTVHVPEPTVVAAAELAPVRTTCPYCGVGCGVLATPDRLGGVSIAGDPDHPSNFGRLCSKGAALGETVGLERRLLHPMIAGRRASWDDALTAVADGFARIVAEHGPDAVAFYLSGQLLTEDYYVANKLMKGFLGSSHVDTNSRLCMASSVAGHRRAFGSDTVPGCYEDLDSADLLVLVGSNAAWCHPVLFRRMQDNGRTRGARIVVIDPRRTETGDEADLFLAIAPGTDTALFCGLLVHLADTGALDGAFIDGHTSGFGDALAQARAVAPDIAATAAATGLAAREVAAFFDLFRSVEKVVTLYSQGVNQSAQGTDKVGAIINCHLATGRIGRPGLGPFSLTGQPNAMGGREVGGLANMLAAHMGFSAPEVDRVRRFWKAPRMAEGEGDKAVALFRRIAEGRIKALWIMATNPAVSLPDADTARAALQQLDLLVVSENVLSTDSISRGAHVLLPACAWGEKDGTVTNSERRISRQRAFLPAPGEAKPDWWMVSEVARRMGFADAFPYSSPAEIFAEHAALSAFENDGSRDFDIGGLAELSAEDYDTLAPVQWPLTEGDSAGRARFFAEGGFYTADRRARFVVPERPALAEAVSERFPYLLNTGRARDQWHTMTRTGSSPRLGSHRPVPYVELHPDDAARLGLATGDLARVETALGSAVLEVIICRRAAAGLAVRADPLEPRDLVGRARRSARACPRRSLFGSARRQGDAGSHHAGAAAAARLRAFARPGGLADRNLVVARGPRGRHRHPLCDRGAGGRRGRLDGAAVPGHGRDRICRQRRRHLPRRRLPQCRPRRMRVRRSRCGPSAIRGGPDASARCRRRRHRPPPRLVGAGPRRRRCGRADRVRLFQRRARGHPGRHRERRRHARGDRTGAQGGNELRIVRPGTQEDHRP